MGAALYSALNGGVVKWRDSAPPELKEQRNATVLYVLTNESTDLCTPFPLASAWFTRNRESSCSPHTTISSQAHL